jgi:hypothetical protein
MALAAKLKIVKVKKLIVATGNGKDDKDGYLNVEYTKETELKAHLNDQALLPNHATERKS